MNVNTDKKVLIGKINMAIWDIMAVPPFF